MSGKFPNKLNWKVQNCLPFYTKLCLSISELREVKVVYVGGVWTMCLGNTCKPMHPKLEYLCTCLNYCLKIFICDSSALSFINNNNFKNICTKAFQAWHEWFRLSKQMFVNQIHIKKTRKFPVSCNKINWLSSKCFLVSI